MVKLLMLPSSDSSNSNSESTSPTSPTSPLEPPHAPPHARPAFFPHQLYPPAPPPAPYCHHPHEKPMVFYQLFPFPAANPIPIPNPTYYHYSPPSFPHYQNYPPQQQHPAGYNFFPQEQTPPPFYHPQTPPCFPESGSHFAVIRGPRSGNGYRGTGVWREWVVRSKPRNPVQSFRNGKCNGWNGNGNGNGGNVGKGNGEGKKVWKPKDEKKEGMIKGKKKKNNKKNERVWSEKKSGCWSSSTTSLLPAELANCTTIMVKNIPNTISRDKFMKLLDNHCREQNGKQDNNDSCQSQYDFIYLPFDFRREQNLGYAFVNFTTVEGVSRLYTSWNNKGWNGDSPKIRVITPAKLQGLEQCRRHFKISVFICNAKEFLPLEFSPPRNGFNCNSSEAKTIGKWVFANRSSIKRGCSAKTIHPPRLNRAHQVIRAPL